MKEYTAPKLEVVTFKVSDVITTSTMPIFASFGIEDGGRAALEDFATL